MNANTFYKELFEDVLGLDVMGLEYMYRDLVELVNRRTLPLFSNMIPCTYYYEMSLEDKKNLITEEFHRPGKEFYIVDENLKSLNIPILGILGYTQMTEDVSIELATPGYGAFNMTDIMLGSENAASISLMQSGFRYKKLYELIGDNVVRLTNFPTLGKIELKLKISFPSISSITEDYKEAFMGLAKLDIKAKLYNELKYLEDVVTPLGNLNLKISDWESAERDRDDYIKELRRMSFPDRVMAGSNYVIF